MTRYLIVNADDFGYSPGVSEGILRAHHEGIVTSTTVLVNAPMAAEGISLVQRSAPELGIGLHLTLTSGKPISAAKNIPDLVQADGTFYRPEVLSPRLPQIDISQVDCELRAQVDRFTEVAGRAPDHLDSHHHITYSSPEVISAMIHIAQDLAVPIRSAFPDRPSVRADVRMPEYFLDCFFGEHTTLGDLLNILVDVPEGVSELMCHPAIVDDALRASSDYNERRSDELLVLTHPSVRELIAAEGIELVSFRWFSENEVSA